MFLKNREDTINNILDIDLKSNTENIKDFIRGYVAKLKKDGAVVGLSGGLDSAVVLKLCSEAIGNENVLAVILPERDSNSKNIKDAIRLARELKIKYMNKKITLILSLIGIYRMYPPSFLFKKSIVEKYITRKRKSISESLGKDLYISNLTGSSNKELCRGLAYCRIKNRVRSALLFYYAELNNYLLVGCANKSEWMIGYFIKYGDGIADIMPVISFYKTQMFAMADYLKLPDYIVNKAPSPDILPGIIDEDMIGISYRKLDIILYGLEKKYSVSKIARISGATYDEIKRVIEIIDKSGYLRKWPVMF